MGDIIIIAVLVITIGMVIRSMVKSHKNGIACSCNCRSCNAGCGRIRDTDE